MDIQKQNKKHKQPKKKTKTNMMAVEKDWDTREGGRTEYSQQLEGIDMFYYITVPRK